MAAVPAEYRTLVTSHDSLGYFAERYGLEVIGTVFPGGTTERNPSAQEMAELVEDIRAVGATAVFTETILSDALARRIAEEAGSQIVNGLYTGSLGEPGGDAGTYLDMMRYNVATIVEALK